MKLIRITPTGVLTLNAAEFVEYEGIAGFSVYIPNVTEGCLTLCII